MHFLKAGILGWLASLRLTLLTGTLLTGTLLTGTCLMGISAALAQDRVEGRMVDIALERPSATLPTFVLPNPQAQATLILLPGGDAGTGKIEDGKPGSGNFLSRSREYFHAAGFNVIVAYRPADMRTLEYEYRVTREHVAEIARVIAFASKEFGKPVWLVGTSRGSVSATAAAIALGQEKVQGLVLSSSVTSQKEGAITTQNIASIRVPTLVVHHKNDACRICVPEEASRIPAALTNAPVRKFILIEGGSNPRGETCGAQHWHGYINFEKETAQQITDWIRAPQS